VSQDGPLASRRQRRQRAARRALLWGLASFVALQLGLAVAIECWLPQLRDPFYAYKAARLHRRVAAVPRPFTVVMLGTSRTTYGLKAGDLEERLQALRQRPVVAFNFGIPGAGPLTQLLALKRLLADGVRPDVLLVEVLPPLLNGLLPKVEFDRLPAHRLWLGELPLLARYGASLPELRNTWWQEWPVPWYSHRFAIVSATVPTLLSWQIREDWFRCIDEHGWVDPPYGEVTPEKQRAGVVRARAQFAGYLTNFRVGGTPCAILRELLELCRREKIAAVLVLMPEGTDFRSWYGAEHWAEISAFLRDLQREMDVPLIDGREWVRDEDFADSHHLLPQGADVFTGRLSAALGDMLIQGGR
jgi:hypothetical protein